MSQSATSFVGPVPDVYDGYMVPLIFAPYAEDLAERVAALAPMAVLETAAGTGVVTRAVAPRLAQGARYVVSDLNPPMVEKARARQGEDGRIEWQVADALNLPFGEAEFDVVLCQFGAMFFPDRTRGYAEARRVLKPGAPFVFSVWDSLAHNDIPATAWEGVTGHFPKDPPQFFEKVPHGYHDQALIRRDLAAAGFADVTIEVVTRESRAASAGEAALALTQGTPLRMELAARGDVAGGLGAVTAAAEAALLRRYGDGPIAGKIQALVVTARG